MLRFQWNALRTGHHVTVHDAERADMTLLPGVVAMVDCHLGRNGVNGVGTRVTEHDGSSRVLWPSYLAVHLGPPEPAEPCWRCDEIAASLDRSGQREPAGPPPPRQCGRCRGFFAGDATLPLDLDTGWWSCAPCHELLLGRGAMAVPTWAPKASARVAVRT